MRTIFPGNMKSSKEAILAQTVEMLELMAQALGSLRREYLPDQPKTFALLARSPLEEIRRLQLEIDQLSNQISAFPKTAA